MLAWLSALLFVLYRALPGTPTDQILRWRRERIESERALVAANPRRILIIRP